jgi:hypothetical protein
VKKTERVGKQKIWEICSREGAEGKRVICKSENELIVSYERV